MTDVPTISHTAFTTRPATAADLEALYGHRPDKTVKALVAVYQDRVVAIGGVMIEPGAVYAFSDIAPGTAYTPRAALRFAREVVRHAVSAGHVRAVSTTANEHFLNRLGFRHAGPSEHGDIYQWQS